MTMQHDYVPTPTEDYEDVANRWGSWAGTPVATERKAPEVGVRVTEKKDGGGGSMAKIRAALTWTPRTGENGGWKPLSMSIPILSTLLLFTLLLIAAVELLAQESQKKGALALSPTLADIPQVAMISYQYAPQVVAVVYSLFWSWVDLDIKRMQPWFELSKPEGALAQDSLLLDYPYNFIASVPFTAAKKKHWLTFLSGTAMIVVFWALTPLQASHMGTGVVTASKEREVIIRSQLEPLGNQVNTLTSEFLQDGYATAWMNQSYPPFMTADSAFLPFYLQETPTKSDPPTNWTATTTQLSTELKCWPAAIQHKETPNNNSLEYHFQDGRGCNTTVPMAISENNTMLYIGYDTNPFSEFWLGGSRCPRNKDSQHTFLAIWVQTVANETLLNAGFNITSVFCQTSYYKQDVVLSVDTSALRPDERTMELVSERKLLSEDEFNSTAFEHVLANGRPEDTAKEGDYPQSLVVDPHARLDGFNLTIPTSNMVNYALAGRDPSSNEFANPDLLQEVFSKAHRYLFSLAVSRLLVNETDYPNRTAVYTYPMRGIIVSREISAALEGILGLVAIFTALIIWVSARATSNLHVNPSSVSRMADIFQDSPEFIDLFCSIDNADEKSLSAATQNERFRLVWNEVRQSPQMIVDSEPAESGSNRATVDLQQGYYQPIRPYALRTSSAVLFVICIAATIGGLSYLKWAEVKYHGLTRPSQVFEVQQILESYLPAIIATSIEPFWILVDRLLCVLQPFKDLWRGNAKKEDSIDVSYSSIPPQFVAYRALSSKHYILALVCGGVFLANVLTVSLPAIFDTRDIEAVYPQTFVPQLAEKFDNYSVATLSNYLEERYSRTDSYRDAFYTLMANVSLGTPLPPWTSNEYFFQPWNATNVSKTRNDGFYKVLTRGYGIDPNCKAIQPRVFPVKERDERLIGPSPETCGFSLLSVQTMMREDTSYRDTGRCAAEFLGADRPGNSHDCDEALTFGWARISNSSNINGTIEGSFLRCQPVFRTGLFNVAVNHNGYVESYEANGPLESDIGYELSNRHTSEVISNLHSFMSVNSRGWHNNTFSRDWINHLYLTSNGSRDIIDPAKDVPNPEELRPTIEHLYRSLFTILIGLNTHLFEKGDADEAMEGVRLKQEVRLFLSMPAFIISTAILALDIGLALVLYMGGVVFVLPRMPTSIGSIMAYIAPSTMIRDAERYDERSRTFSFGRFIGSDGKAHVGVDLATQVVPIDPASLGRPRRRWRLHKKKDTEMDGDGTWL